MVHALVLACALAVHAQETRDSVRVDVSEEAMGTTFTVVVQGPDRAALTRGARAALDEAVRLDHLLSNYTPDSEWSRVNRTAAHGPVVVSQELFDVLDASLAYHRQSDGAFDITVGPLMKAWGFFKGDGTLPDKGAIDRAREQVGSRHVRLNRPRRTVQFLRQGIELDPGGVGKGYAIDRMVGVLTAHGVSAAFVSAGGSSIYGLGAPSDDARGWIATVRDPRTPGGTVAEVFLKDQSLSTSGSYERFFRAGGRVYSHIMDPRTGFPATGTSAVSVIAPRTIDSEAWTKAYFVNGSAWAARHRPAGTRVFLCDDTEVAACRWIE